MAKLFANRVLSGSFAELWINGERIAEADGIRISIKAERSDVQIGTDIDSKVTGWRGEGEINLRQVFTRFYNIVANAKRGIDTRITITTALKDPDSFGGDQERYSVSGVALSDIPLINYKTGKVNEQTIKFRFSPSQLVNLSEITPVEVA